MIRQITDETQIEYKKLSNDHYGKRFLAFLKAYGLGYDFCRFYKITQAEKQAYFVVLNSSMTISSIENIDVEEIELFIEAYQIISIEMPPFLAEKFNLSEYITTERVLFEFSKGHFPENMNVNENPKLDEVFDILKYGFPLEDCYDLWLTDTSHQIRHGVSKIFLYNSTTATMYYNIDGFAFFGQVATSPDCRGKGRARELLYWIEDKMSKENVKAYLFAKPERVSYYEAIGFMPRNKDIIFERKNINE